MPQLSRRGAVLAAVGLLSILGFAGAGLVTGKAEAQGLMSAPACQCSAATVVPGISTSLVHCLCGGVACVVSQHSGQGTNANLMQCVRQ